MDATKNAGDPVLPGDALAFSEEYLPGDGVYDDGRFLRAARFGRLEVDNRERRCQVKPFTSVPATLRVGDFVLGLVTLLKPSMAGVEVLHLEGVERNVAGDTNGTLHVSKIAKRYVQDVGREYRLGDVLRARVIEVKPSVQLSTEDPRCGAVMALCLRDRFPLGLVDKKTLECPVCARRDVRNIAPDYGKVFVPAYVALQVPST